MQLENLNIVQKFWHVRTFQGKGKKSDFCAVGGKACEWPEKIKFLIFSFQMVFSVCFLKVENDLTC